MRKISIVQFQIQLSIFHIRTAAFVLPPSCETIEIQTERKFSLPTIRYLDLVNRHRLQAANLERRCIDPIYPLLSSIFLGESFDRARVHRFAIISRRQSATTLRKSYGIHSAAHLRRKKQPRPFFSTATFASNTLAFFRYRRGLITQDRVPIEAI